MTTSTIFDSHEYIKELVAVGITEKQAEVFARQQSAYLNERLVTREYLELKLERLENRLTIKLGTFLAIAVGLIVTLNKVL